MEPCDLSVLEISLDSPVFEFVRRCPDVELRVLNEGEYLIKENEESTDVYLMLSGAYVVERPSEIPNQAPAILSMTTCEPDSPSFIGEMAHLDDTPRTASVRIFGRSFALRLNPKHLDVIMEEFPFFTRILCRQFAHRLSQMNEALKDFQGRFAMNSERLFLPAGEVLFRKGEKADILYQLISGEVIREDTGEPVDSSDLDNGFLDFEVFLRDGEHPFTAKTNTPASMVSISKDSKAALIRRYPEALLQLFQQA